MKDQKLIIAVLIIVLIDVVLLTPFIILTIVKNEVAVVLLSSEINVSYIWWPGRSPTVIVQQCHTALPHDTVTYYHTT